MSSGQNPLDHPEFSFIPVAPLAVLYLFTTVTGGQHLDQIFLDFWCLVQKLGNKDLHRFAKNKTKNKFICCNAIVQMPRLTSDHISERAQGL